jgi:hypothetical protein
MSEDAVSWCLRGAVIKALQPSFHVLTVDLHHGDSQLNKYIANVFGFETAARMTQYNDTQGRTQQQVLERIDALLDNGGHRRGKNMEHNDAGGESGGTEGAAA